MESMHILSDEVYEELFDVYLSFKAIQGLISAIPQDRIDLPKGFDTLFCRQVTSLEKVIAWLAGSRSAVFSVCWQSILITNILLKL